MAIKLNKKQLEGLDLLIAAKEMDPRIVNWVDIVQVTVDVVTVTVGAAADANQVEQFRTMLANFGKLTVDQLIEAKKQATGH